MIPRILHFSVPDRISRAQSGCIERAKALNPTWDVKVWHDDTLQGGRLSHLLAKCNSGAQRGDLIRLDALIEMGGVYLDTDFLVHRSLDPLIDNYTFFICSEDGYNLTNAAFGATPRHPALLAISDTLLKREPDWSLPPNETTGPGLFSTVLKWRSDIALLPRDTFYQYNYNEKPSAHIQLYLAFQLLFNSLN
jgi:mannosyltransferase OCH1-like enzyme